MQEVTEQQSNLPPANGKLAGLFKTLAWLGIFLVVGWSGYGLLSGRSSKTVARPSLNDTLKDGWVIGENERVRALVQEYEPINFIRLSDFAYFQPDPWEKPDPKKTAYNVIPPAVKAMHGHKYALTGFMLPLNAGPDGLTEFILNGSQDMCYFGAPVQMNEWVHVKFVGRSGKVPFTHFPLTVFGVLEVGEVKKDGRVESIYRLQAQAISTPKGVIE